MDRALIVLAGLLAVAGIVVVIQNAIKSRRAYMTIWACTLCGYASWIAHGRHTPDSVVIRKIKENHAGMRPDCVASEIVVRPLGVQVAKVYYEPPTS